MELFIRVWVGCTETTRDGNYPGAKVGGQGATHLSQRGKVVNDYLNLESGGHPHRTCDLGQGTQLAHSEHSGRQCER